MNIPFNKPFLTGKETHYLYQAVRSGKISGNGLYTQKSHEFFEKNYGFYKTLLTTSCTDALEMAALLFEIQPGDEVIAPTFTFVSTVNAFVLRGAKIIFADSESNTPNLDISKLEELISVRTKAIVPVHYAGMSCDMDPLLALASKYNIKVVEDAAQSIDSYYKGRPLGGIGDLGAFSFHETKNIISGEGGMLVINDQMLSQRAEIIWEKGTNRAAFWRGEVDKYGWVDVGSSFLPSEIIAAFLYAQIENIEDIQSTRKAIWHRYYDGLKELETAGYIQLPQIPEYATNNAHMFCLLCASEEKRGALIGHLKAKGIHAVFHYLALHQSPFFKDKHDGRTLPNAVRYTNTLLRLPLYYELNEADQNRVIDEVKNFFR